MRLRRSIRLASYDYRRPGAYFITLVAHQRQCVFGEARDGIVVLSEAGNVLSDCWRSIRRHFSGCTTDTFVVMPNHLHGVLIIHPAAAANAPTAPRTLGPPSAIPAPVGATHASPPPGPRRGSIGAIVGSFKSATTRLINDLRSSPGAQLWQRNYYEHVIRDAASLTAIRDYIASNPARWASDAENPDVRRRR